ncbi:hypothetical protein J1792_31675 [Streptomyces triculaminicus]|uniref:Uncharacterized protein n=2 Tax=Streptomyces TaxID=1883 RepID=A0A939FRJ1_9ACTN|nr:MULTISPECIES: hypothetical protein [Streptomyces]MBO0657121.1 hypothetical protein [Streptomyces triculaminicus]QSY49492.1 hypothetical protein J3S04_32115 [Streptomyces griseocarneus]
MTGKVTVGGRVDVTAAAHLRILNPSGSQDFSDNGIFTVSDHVTVLSLHLQGAGGRAAVEARVARAATVISTPEGPRCSPPT